MTTTTPDLRALTKELLQYARVAQAILLGEGLWDVDDDEGLFDRADKALATQPPEPPTDDFLKSYPEVTRVEVITNKGREFVRYECSTVQVSFQDDGQTIKVFLFSTYD